MIEFKGMMKVRLNTNSVEEAEQMMHAALAKLDGAPGWLTRDVNGGFVELHLRTTAPEHLVKAMREAGIQISGADECGCAAEQHEAAGVTCKGSKELN